MTTIYGTALERTEYEQMHDKPRSVIGEVTTSIAGNHVLRIGREHEPDGPWSLTEHVVLTPDESLQLVGDLLRANGWTAGELRAAARAANGAATIRAAISEFTADEHANPLASEVPPLERVAGKLAQLAETLDGNR